MDFISLLALIASLAGLGWAADLFVVSASRIGETLRLPKMVVGILLVGFATTAPELAVSVQSAYLGHPEIALGNALGSVLADDGLAMALAAIFSVGPIVIEPRILKSAGLFLISIDVLAYVLAWNGHISRIEGAVLLIILGGYYWWVLWSESRRRTGSLAVLGRPKAEDEEFCRHPLGRCFLLFGLGLAGVIVASRLIIWAATRFAVSLGISEAVIGLTMIAFGTSLPEMGACIAAARRGEGQIAVGNILGADILNILWIIGMSAAVAPITVEREIINFAFPWMLGIVLTMLLLMRIGHRLTKIKGVVLILIYAAYVVMIVREFY